MQNLWYKNVQRNDDWMGFKPEIAGVKNNLSGINCTV